MKNDSLITADEWADNRARHAMRSAVVALVAGSAASIGGCWHYALAYGGGTTVAGFVTISATVFLALGVHLRSALGAARTVDRVEASAYRIASLGGWVLVALTLTVNYSTLHALAAAVWLEPISAALIPLAPDIAIVVATAAIFTIKPQIRPMGRKAPVAPTVATTPRRETSESVVPSAVARAETAPTTIPEPTPSDRSIAARLVAAGKTTKPADEVAIVFAAHRAGMRQGQIAAHVGWHRATIPQVLKAADGLDGDDESEPVRQLAAVRAGGW